MQKANTVAYVFHVYYFKEAFVEAYVDLRVKSLVPRAMKYKAEY